MDYNQSQPPAARVPQVPAAVSDLQDAVERLQAISDEFGKRLSSVTRSEPCEAVSEDKQCAPAPSTVEVASRIIACTGFVRLVCERLDRVMSRLEL